MTLAEAPSAFPARPPWSGIGADGWDGTVCPDDLRLLSASSVPKVLHSRALEEWALGETIKGIVDRRDEFDRIIATDGIDAAIDWAKELRWEPKEGQELNAADSGTLMHSLWEAWLRGETPAQRDREIVERDPVLLAMANNLWEFFCRSKPVAVALEQVVYDPVNGLAGRLDAIVQFTNPPKRRDGTFVEGNVLIDLKNPREGRTKGGAKKRPYGDSHALQLATYKGCPYMASFEPRLLRTQKASSTRVYLLNPREIEACRPMPEIHATGIVHNTPDECRFYEIDAGPAVHRRVIEAVGMHRWLNEESRSVVGDPLMPAIDMPALA